MSFPAAVYEQCCASELWNGPPAFQSLLGRFVISADESQYGTWPLAMNPFLLSQHTEF